jgi:hypothetical protein
MQLNNDSEASIRSSNKGKTTTSSNFRMSSEGF